MMTSMRNIATPTVRPEPVEGLSFFSCASAKEGQGFDKLSPNRIWCGGKGQ